MSIRLQIEEMLDHLAARFIGTDTMLASPTDKSAQFPLLRSFD